MPLPIPPPTATIGKRPPSLPPDLNAPQLPPGGGLPPGILPPGMAPPDAGDPGGLPPGLAGLLGPTPPDGSMPPGMGGMPPPPIPGGGMGGGGQYGDLLALLKTGLPMVGPGLAELLQLEDQGDGDDQGDQSPLALALRGGGSGAGGLGGLMGGNIPVPSGGGY